MVLNILLRLPKFSEALLVKRLEEYGIGRPSTYASIISTLQDRAMPHLQIKGLCHQIRVAWYVHI